MDDVPHFYAKDRAAWRNWLGKNHDKALAVWLIYDKGKNRKLTWEDIVQESLCFGWVDSKAGTFSDTQSKIYVSKRKPTSRWSKINKSHIESLTRSGLMTKYGLEAVAVAKQNGSWDILNKSDNLELPPELESMFLKNPVAKANFEAFSPSSKRLILQWVYDAKRDETRQKRIHETVTQATRNIKAKQ